MNPSAVAALQLQHKSAAVAWAESQGAVGVANPMASIPAGGAIGAAGTGAGTGAGAARGVVGQARPGSLVFNPLMAAGGSGIVATSPRAGGGTTLGAGAGAGPAGNVSPLPTARTARWVPACAQCRVFLCVVVGHGAGVARIDVVQLTSS